MALDVIGIHSKNIGDFHFMLQNSSPPLSCGNLTLWYKCPMVGG